MRPRTRPTLAALLLHPAACGDPARPLLTPPRERTPAISDAARDADGIAGFYFLPPVLPAVAYPGTFDATLSPDVVICEWSAGACAAEVARFTGVPLGGPDWYQVNWHTRDYQLDPARTYRIIASAAGAPLGYVDVDLVSGGSELRNVNTAEYIPLLDGRTLPIKFRIERGVAGRVAVTPDPVDLEVGETRALAATAYDLHDAPIEGATFRWSLGVDAGSEGAASLTEAGAITGLVPGAGAVRATTGGRIGSARFTVHEPPASIAFARSCGTLGVGTTETLAATAYDAAGAAITRPLRVTYASESPAVATVDGAELAGVAPGLATITASTGYATVVSGSTRRLVHAVPGAGLATVGKTAEDGSPSADAITMEPEDEVQLAAVYAGASLLGAELADCRTWSSSDEEVAAVSAEGRVTAKAAGTATITIAVGDLTGSVSVTVQAPPPPPPPPAPDPTNETTAVPFNPLWVQMVGNDVNTSGVVVGTISIRSGVSRAFRWGTGEDTVTQLPNKGASICVANAISNKGRIGGYCTWSAAIEGLPAGTYGVVWYNPAGAPWSDAHMTLYPSPSTSGSRASQVWDVNDDGPDVLMTGQGGRPLACGAYTCGAFNGVRWRNGTGANLGWLGVWVQPSSVGFEINPSGVIAGSTTVPLLLPCNPGECPRGTDVPRPGRIPAGLWGDLGVSYVPPYNAGTGVANGINAGGDIVGAIDQYLTSNGSTRRQATYWPVGALRQAIPGVPAYTVAASVAMDINDARWIVGGYAGNAFVWKGGGVATVLDPLYAGGSATANAVSELVGGKAYVAGTGRNASGKTVAMRWLVVP